MMKERYEEKERRIERDGDGKKKKTEMENGKRVLDRGQCQKVE